MTWQKISLKEICELNYGKALKSEERQEGKFPVFGSNGIVGYHNVPLIKKSTIIVGRKGSIGEVHYCESPCWPIDTTYFLDFDKNLINGKWLAYVLKNLNLKNLNKSAAIPGLNRDDVYRKKILLPPFDEQTRIAYLLSRVEKLIDQRRESIRLLDELVRSIFLEMFGDPVRNEKRWEKLVLSSLGTLDRGVSKHRPRNAPELLGGDYPLIQTGDVTNSGLFIRNYNQTYSEIGLNQSKLWVRGTLCITIAANIARTGILDFDACFPDSIVGFNSFPMESNEFYIYFIFQFFQKILEKNAPQAAQKNINLEILRNLLVPKPPIRLQEKFADIIIQIDNLQSQYQSGLLALENLYGSLSQRAFRGELDLSRMEVLIPELELEEKKDNLQMVEEGWFDSDYAIDIARAQVPKIFVEIQKFAIALQNDIKPAIKAFEEFGKNFSDFKLSFEEFIKKLQTGLTFDELWEWEGRELDYEPMKNQLLSYLKRDKPVLIQDFDEVRKQIVFRLNETHQT